jgi:hypothetical protein
MATLVPEFPVERTVPAEGYEEVTDEVPVGLVVVQVILTLQLLAPEATVHVGEAGVRVPLIWLNVAVTVQFPVMAGVV